MTMLREYFNTVTPVILQSNRFGPKQSHIVISNRHCRRNDELENSYFISCIFSRRDAINCFAVSIG